VSIRENVVSALVKEIISLGSISSGEQNIDDKLLEQMLKDMDIAQALQLMTQTVTSKEWKIETDVPEYVEVAENIQRRLNNLNVSKLLENILRAEIYKKSIFEIIYDKDNVGNTVIKDLILLPNKYIKYDKDSGWVVKTRDSEIAIASEPSRFLVCVNEERLDNLQGSTDLLPLVPVFTAKERLESKLNAIIEKYGDIITVFAYEPSAETDPPEVIKARQKDVEAQAKDLKAAKGKDVLAVPSAGEKSLDDFIKFIKLDDLKPEIYQELLNEKAKSVQRYLLGSTLVVGVDGNSGNRALGEVHKEQQNYKIESKVKKIRDWIQKLIEIDAQLYGYDSGNFYFKFVEEIDEAETLELEDKRTKTISEKVNYIVKIAESGYAFTKSKIAEILGVEEIDLVEIEKESGSLEFSKPKKKLNINKINKKRELIEKNQARFDKFIDNNFKKWQKKVLKAVREKIEKANDISDLYDLEFDYDNTLEDMLLMSMLQGFDNAVMIDNEIVEFSNTRTTTRNAALDNFLKKYPALYNDIENEMEYARQKYFWIKKVTDVNVTEKIFKQMSNTLENGGTFKEWKKDVDNILSQSGLTLNEGYLKTVFRTNMNHAYNTGIYMKMDKYKERYPYYQYCGTLDGREQEHTRELNGKIFKIGTPEADKYFPPNGFNCRCYTISLTADEVNPDEVVGNGDINQDVGSFAGNIGNSEYIEMLEKNYKQKVDTFADKYDIPDFVLTKPLKKDGNSSIIDTIKTVKEANNYAEKVLGVKADYTGIDVRCANEWNRGLAAMKNKYPEVAEQIKFVGSMQKRNELLKAELKNYAKNNKLAKGTKELLDYVLGKLNIKSNRTAESFHVTRLGNNPDENEIIKIVNKYAGISLNSNYYNNYDNVIAERKRQVTNGWKPVGCDTMKSIFDHEFGHQIDKLLNVSDIQNVKDFYKRYKEEIKEGLSKYALTKREEFIAEVWSEYNNNPKPREIANEVGKFIERLWREWKEKNH
jgi:phage head morphogenesis protein, SPP1 gp7 family